MRILFGLSGLEEGSTNALKHYAIEFTEPVNADWLAGVIRRALDITEAAERFQAVRDAYRATYGGDSRTYEEEENLE